MTANQGVKLVQAESDLKTNDLVEFISFCFK